MIETDIHQVKKIQYFQVGMSLASNTTSSGTRFSLKKGPKVTVTSRDFLPLTGALHVHQHGAHVGATWPVARLVERTNKVMGRLPPGSTLRYPMGKIHRE